MNQPIVKGFQDVRFRGVPVQQYFNLLSGKSVFRNKSLAQQPDILSMPWRLLAGQHVPSAPTNRALLLDWEFRPVFRSLTLPSVSDLSGFGLELCSQFLIHTADGIQGRCLPLPGANQPENCQSPLIFRPCLFQIIFRTGFIFQLLGFVEYGNSLALPRVYEANRPRQNKDKETNMGIKTTTMNNNRFMNLCLHSPGISVGNTLLCGNMLCLIEEI